MLSTRLAVTLALICVIPAVVYGSDWSTDKLAVALTLTEEHVGGNSSSDIALALDAIVSRPVGSGQLEFTLDSDYDRAFEQVDLSAGPVTPTSAFRIGEKADDPLAMYLYDLYTVSTNLAGVAGISIPCGFSSKGGAGGDGLPIGLHLQAPTFAEEKLLRGAQMFQSKTDWHRREASL